MSERTAAAQAITYLHQSMRRCACGTCRAGNLNGDHKSQAPEGLPGFLTARIEYDLAVLPWDPEVRRTHPDVRRAVTDIEAKRRIIELHAHDDMDGNLSCGQCDFGGYGRWWCMTLRLLALPYADHPDYREEWKP